MPEVVVNNVYFDRKTRGQGWTTNSKMNHKKPVHSREKLTLYTPRWSNGLIEYMEGKLILVLSAKIDVCET